MAELLRNAWQGWFRVTDEGKLMALFMGSLLFLWIGYEREKQKQLLRYGIMMAICCVLPVTAVILMLYQTKFYDYEWIWSAVPVTVLTAYAGTKILSECWQGFRREAWRKGLPVTAGLLLLAYLCSGPGGAYPDRRSAEDRKAETEGLLEIIKTEEETVCLWAPQDIMQYVRAVDGSVLLPYGRDMWQEALGAYSYDTYPADIKKMYRWMCIVEEYRTEDGIVKTDILREAMEEQKLSTGSCLDAAKRAGVNFLALPDDADIALLNEVTEYIGAEPRQNQGYYLFRLKE